jgi:antitoxin (DNA-binding transcriptional repressor) of toxin-antitoxin stability system
MTRVGMREAKAQLSTLIKRVEGGEEIMITRHDEPAVVWSSPGNAARASHRS